jgi:hypothetical protein
MSIGGTLAKARRDAGLTVTQVSERTRIRETIIRGIEGDDYSACGGDFYARGHIRSIARVIGTDPVPLIAEYDETVRAPSEITAADALQPILPISGGDEPRRRPNLTAILVVALLAAVGLLAYLFIAAPGRAPAPAALSPPHHHAGRPAARPRPTVSRVATPSPRPSPTPPAPTALTPVSVVAFGPGGASTGDNPGQASQAISGGGSSGWNTNWYGTPNFGNLQSGTGLLLDLGQPVTITSAQIRLGSTPGADLELRVGSVPALADLQTVATAANAGGVLQLAPTASVRGRYLLIWFTKLPPDDAGTFQAFIYAIELKGRA